MTAVEWLVKQICGKHTEAWHEEIQQALEMEKQQIIKHETLPFVNRIINLKTIKMKTAVQYLVKEFSDILGKLETKPMQDLLLVDAIQKAKEMEKKQIINSYDQDLYGGINGHRKFENGNEYYSETFNEEGF